MSETCCTRLAENTGRKNDAKIAIWAPSLSGYIFATKALIDNRKKLEAAISPLHVLKLW